jgi:hypothetical protein
MRRLARDEERERRISMEIVVDAYGPEEQAMGWYYSLEDLEAEPRRAGSPQVLDPRQGLRLLVGFGGVSGVDEHARVNEDPHGCGGLRVRGTGRCP